MKVSSSVLQMELQRFIITPGATTLRITKSRIRARIRSEIPIAFSQERISAHGGLELVRRFLETLDFRRRLAETTRGVGREGDYGPVRILMALMGMLILGGALLDPLWSATAKIYTAPAQMILGSELGA